MKRRITFLILTLKLSSLLLLGQNNPHSSFLSEEDQKKVSRNVGELFFSQKNLRINDFIIKDTLKFVTSIDEPNHILVYDNSNLLIEKLEINAVEDRITVVSGIYQDSGEVMLAPRPLNKDNYLLKFKRDKFKVQKLKGIVSKKSDQYYFKHITYNKGHIIIKDFYTPSRSEGLASVVLYSQNKESSIDTLSKITGTFPQTFLNAYNSWTFDALKTANGNLLLADFYNGSVTLFDNTLTQVSNVQLTDFFPDSNLSTSYFLGTKYFYFKIFRDSKTDELYLYFGKTDSYNKTVACLFLLDEESKKWSQIPVLDNRNAPYPFVNIKQIHNGYIYFPLKFDGTLDSIYRLKLN